MNRKEMAIISAIIFLSVIAWIVFGVQHIKTTTTVSQKELRQIIPLTPVFDVDTLKKLKSKEE